MVSKNWRPVLAYRIGYPSPGRGIAVWKEDGYRTRIRRADTRVITDLPDFKTVTTLPTRVQATVLDPNSGEMKALDVTWAVLDMSASAVSSLRDGSPQASLLAERLLMTDGPHEVSLEKAISSYMGVADIEEITDELMEEARSAFRYIGPWRDPEALLDAEEAEFLLEDADFICESIQDNDAERWWLTRNGQIVRITGLDKERIRVVDPIDARDMLLGWVEDVQARKLFGDEAAEFLFKEMFPSGGSNPGMGR